MDHDEDDTDIEGYIDAASSAVINYLDGAVDFVTTTSGELELDANGEPDAPFEVRAATLLLVAALYKGEDSGDLWTPNYLPIPVTSLLYPLRLPVIG